jgi:hypothetical protein
MSLATLKAKTKQQQNISSGGFSLHGGVRNTSYIGKTNNHAKTTYSSNNSSIIKTSTSNNKALLQSRHKEKPIAKYVAGSSSSSEQTKDLRLSEEICSSVSNCRTVYRMRTFNGFDSEATVTGIVLLADVNSIGFMVADKPYSSDSSHDLPDVYPVNITKTVNSSTVYIRGVNNSNELILENVTKMIYQANESSAFYSMRFVLSDNSNISSYTNDMNTYFNDIATSGDTGIEIEVSVGHHYLK